MVTFFKISSIDISCFEDIFHSILNAKHLVYISCWGIDPNIRLNRNPNSLYSNITLGSLLLDKAIQGVKVLIHLWKEGNAFGLDTQHTGWKAAKKYFKGTKVVCKTSYPADSEKSKITGFFTHHEKALICDNGEEKDCCLKAFVGGYDFLKGFIFGILQKFYNILFKNRTF